LNELYISTTPKMVHKIIMYQIDLK